MYFEHSWIPKQKDSSNYHIRYMFFLWSISYLFQIVEFVAVLLKTRNEVAEKELVNSGTIGRIVDLFFE